MLAGAVGGREEYWLAKFVSLIDLEAVSVGGALSYLFTRQSGFDCRQAQQHAVGRRCDRACAQQLVQERLGAVAGCGCQVGLERGGREEGVWVVGHEQPEIEGVGGGLLHRDGKFGRAF